MHRLYFTNSRNSTASLADYYYPYKYEVDNTNVSTQQGKNAEDATSNNNVNSTSDATSSNTKPVKENVAKIAAKVPPSAKVKITVPMLKMLSRVIKHKLKKLMKTTIKWGKIYRPIIQ